MAKKPLNTSFEQEILNNFKAECAKQGHSMNKVLEMFMIGFINGDFTISMSQNSKEEIRK